jgi:ABC-type glycerol-3-phosphate transport system permease component
MMLPSSTIMIPLFRTVQQLHLLDRVAGLTLVYCALQLPFSTYLMSTYFRRVPKEVVEAARVDGAGPWRTLVEVCLPLVRPGLLTLVTLNFLWLWNELLYALLINQNNSHRTLMVGLALLNGEHSTAVPLIAAGLVFALVPPLVVFGFFQRNLAEGVTAGAVKYPR